MKQNKAAHIWWWKEEGKGREEKGRKGREGERERGREGDEERKEAGLASILLSLTLLCSGSQPGVSIFRWVFLSHTLQIYILLDLIRLTTHSYATVWGVVAE